METDGRLCPGLASKATTSVEDFRRGPLTFKLFIAFLFYVQLRRKQLGESFICVVSV